MADPTERPPMQDERAPELPDSAEPSITDEGAPMPDMGFDERIGSGVGDLFRKALLAGVGAVFMTEEGIRKTVTELKLPKEAFAYLAGQAERTRTEASRILRKEVRRFLNSENFKQQLASLVSGLTLEVKAEIRLKPDSATPDVKAKMRVKGDESKSGSDE